MQVSLSRNSIVGKRTIQPNALDPYMCKIHAAKLRESYIYDIF
jgi:hypothetical protein